MHGGVGVFVCVFTLGGVGRTDPVGADEFAIHDASECRPSTLGLVVEVVLYGISRAAVWALEVATVEREPNTLLPCSKSAGRSSVVPVCRRRLSTVELVCR